MTLLAKRMVEKPWGKDILPAPFEAPEGQRIGEVWFEPPPELPSILVKYIFTSEKLSVQVHPSDAQAAKLGENGRGKEECWLVIAAEPGATLGVGFKHSVDSEAMRNAALDGSIEEMLEWYPVAPGDFFYIPAGTVHAIGAGVSLIEIQQNSDITYRLYDYGRPRELHLDKGIAVSKGESHDPALRRHIANAGTLQLVAGPYFNAWRIEGALPAAVVPNEVGPFLVIPLDGIVDSGNARACPGDCIVVSSIAEVVFERSGSCLVVQALDAEASQH